MTRICDTCHAEIRPEETWDTFGCLAYHEIPDVCVWRVVERAIDAVGPDTDAAAAIREQLGDLEISAELLAQWDYRR